MALLDTKNYTLGRGKLYFSRFKSGTQTPSGYFYFGNTPEFNLTIESETLDHFDSDEGVREKDDSVPLQTTRTGSLITDNIQPANVALFFFGDASTVTVVGGSGNSEDFEDVIAGHSYQIGETAADPGGTMGISEDDFNVSLKDAVLVAATGTITFSSTGPADGETVQIGDQVYTFRNTPADPYDVDINATPTTQGANFAAAVNNGAGEGTAYGTGTEAHPDVSASNSSGTVTITAKIEGTAGNAISLAEDATNTAKSGTFLTGGTGTSYIEGTDYTMDYANGFLKLLSTGAITSGLDITVDFTTLSSTRDRVISGSTPVEGALKFIANNPKGKNINYKMPYVKITPNGDYALKGEEWQQIPFNLEILKPTSGLSEAIYADGVPAYS